MNPRGVDRVGVIIPMRPEPISRTHLSPNSRTSLRDPLQSFAQQFVCGRPQIFCTNVVAREIPNFYRKGRFSSFRKFLVFIAERRVSIDCLGLVGVAGIDWGEAGESTIELRQMTVTY